LRLLRVLHSFYTTLFRSTVATADAAAVEHALKTAHGLYRNRDAWLPAVKRIEILEKAVALMKERAEFLAVEAAREGGKPLIDSRDRKSTRLNCGQQTNTY